jgi:hypothetical protein
MAVKEGIPDCLVAVLTLVILILSGIGILSLVLYVVFNYGYGNNANGTVTTNNILSNSTDINNIMMFMNMLSQLLSPTGFSVNYEP